MFLAAISLKNSTGDPCTCAVTRSLTDFMFSDNWYFNQKHVNKLPARLLHDFGPIVTANFAESFIAINDWKVHNLSVCQKKWTVRCWKKQEWEKYEKIKNSIRFCAFVGCRHSFCLCVLNRWWNYRNDLRRNAIKLGSVLTKFSIIPRIGLSLPLREQKECLLRCSPATVRCFVV